MRWINPYSDDQTDSDAIMTNIYLDKLYPYLNICQDNKVLEIGPFMGIHTQVAQSYNPEKITLVELNKGALKGLRAKFSTCENIEIIEDDIFHYLENPREFDVVLCLGVLYHLHASLYLLELIVNRVSPKYVCIESYDTSLYIHKEDDNTPGARQLSSGWKSANITIKLPKETIISAMKNLGYKLNTEITDLVKWTAKPFFCVFEKL